MMPFDICRSHTAMALIGAVATGAFVGVAVLIAIVPWPISFAIAVSSATAWCAWLEHRPHR
jgi:hypothetical protein